jgi:integrase
VPKLTKTIIEELEPRTKPKVIPPGAKPRYVWDTQTPGFGIKVTPSGTKTYVFKYRAGEGGRSAVQRWYKIGLFGSISIEEARRQVAKLVVQITDGTDPQRVREDLREAMTVQDLWDRFEREHLPKVKSSTSEDYKAMWKNHIKPEFGTSKIKDITRKEIIALHLRISKKAPYTANRMVAALSKLFNCADKWELVSPGANPCRHVERNKEHSRTRFLSNKELTALGIALRTGLALQEEDHYMAVAIQLLLLTGARVSEILGTRWEWVDLEKRLITLPDSKTGPKTIYLSEPAVALISALQRLPRSKGQTYMIRGRIEGRPFDNLRKVWRRVSKRADITGARLHDLRHTAASIGVNGGLTLPIIGRLLGHTQVSTTQRYAHIDTNPALLAADLIGRTITATVGASPLLSLVESIDKETATQSHAAE